MADINTMISVDVTGIGEVDALASSAKAADAALSKLAETAGKGLDFSAGAAAGVDKLVAQYRAAFAKIGDDWAKLQADMAKAGASGGGADAAAASLGRIADAEKAAAGQADAMAASIGRADDTLKSLGGTGDSAAAGIGRLSDAQKSAAETGAGLRDTSAGVSDGLKVQADQTAALTALQADMADSQKALTSLSAEHAAVMADANAKIAAGQRLGTMAAKDASGDAVASYKAQSAAAAQAAADAEASSSKHSMAVLGLAAALGYGVDKAAQLQTSVTRLYTSAGEQQKNLPLITQGILGLSGPTDTSQSALASGAYWAESAGFHGKNALAVLKAAAEGAKAEGAEMPDVANALTTTLNDYYGGPQKSSAVQGRQSVQAMNEIIAAVGQGKMTLQGLSGALPILLPAAKQAGLSLPQVLGAEATMTSQGISTQESAQLLKHTMGALQKPSSIQSAEMQMLGIDPVQLSHDLGKRGLTGTISEVDDAIQKHMGPGGMVLLDTMNRSKLAVQSARAEIAAMPPQIQGVAKEYLAGSISAKAFNQAVRQGPESARDANLLKQFESTAGTALGFSSLIKAGMGNKQTEAAALSMLMGGQEGSQVGLALGGDHLKTFKNDVDNLGQSAQHTGSDIRGWNDIQGTLNYKIGSFVKSAEALATQAGLAALPAVTDVMKGLTGAAGFLASNPEIAKPLMAGGGILAAGYALQKVQQPVTTALQGVGKVAETLHIPGLDKLAGVGKDTGLAGAATGLSGAATSLDGAAGSLEGAAASLRGGAASGAGSAVPGAARTAERDAAATAERDAAAAGEVAAGGAAARYLGGARNIIGGLGEVASRMVMPLAIAATAKSIGDEMAPSGSNAGKITSITQHSSLAGSSGALDIGGWFGMLAEHMPDVFGQSARTQTSSIAGGGRYAALTGNYRVAPPPPAPVPVAAPAESQMPHLYAAAGHPGTVTGGPQATAATVKAKIDLDTSELTSVKQKAAQVLSGLGQGIKPVKVPAPDLSGLDAGKAKAMQAMNGISQALGSAKPAKIPEPDTSGIQAAKAKAAAGMNGIVSTMQSAAGPAHAAGAAVSAGLAAGIQAGEGAAVAAARAEASAVAAALQVSLQTHSPSKVTYRTGEDFSAGLAEGISSPASKAKSKKSATDLSASTVNSLITGLQGGQSAIDTAMAALGSPAKPQDITTIQSTVAKLKTDLANALKKGDISKSEDSALTRFLDRDNKRLQQLAAQRTKLETELQNAQQIGQGVISQASVLNAGQAQPAESITAQASSQTVQGMQYQAQQQSQFASQLAQLQKQGLNAQSLSQLAQGGADAGLPVTEGLVGNKGAISQINQSEKQIMAAANQIGTVGGTAGYQAGKQVASQIGQGLQGQLKSIDSQMKNVAHSMVSAVEAGLDGKGLKAAMSAAGASAGQGFAAGIASETGAAAAAAASLAQAAENAAKAALKSHSPSLVFREVGLSIPQGTAQGIDSGLGLVTAAVGRMGQGAMSGHPFTGTPMAVPYGSGGGGNVPQQVTHHHYNVTVQGSVTSERDLLDSLQSLQLERAGNNFRGGWNLPYKGA